MRRRDFLRLLLASPIAATLDVERLLWVPSPLVTVPAMPAALVGNRFVTPECVTALGFSLRFVKQYNVLADQNLTRIDWAAGPLVTVPRPRVHVSGSSTRHDGTVAGVHTFAMADL